MWLSQALLILSLPGCFSIRGPSTVTGPEQGSLTLQCHYDTGWERHRKWWCRGAGWDFCRILVQTSESGYLQKKGRVLISDNQSNRLFTVTMQNLSKDDADTYWCGIEKFGTDLGVQVKVIVHPVGAVPMNQDADLLARPTDSSSAQATPFVRTRYVLLVFVKVPILLILLGAILWLKESQKVPKKQWGQPLYVNMSADRLSKGTAC
ncbi:CMRF35-like molecule 7 [Tamandua tetradactyla]|uniref:CMRF35-like molecule 7 n=1 Tax=Tamandua tetradactyla TaxID=48850 RepID=UPI004053EE3B